MLSKVAHLLPVAILLGTTSLASADFGSSYFSLGARATQTGDATLGATTYDAQFNLGYTVPGDITGATLTLPNSGTLSANGFGFLPPALIFQKSYTSEGAFNAEFGVGGNYGVVVNTGTLAGIGGAFSVPSGVMPTVIPRLTGDSFTRIQGMRVDQDLVLTTSAFSNDSFGSVMAFHINDWTTGVNTTVRYVYNGALDTVTIPANFLQPFHSYRWTITEHDPDFTTILTSTGTYPLQLSATRTTYGDFITGVPEPASLAALGLGLLGLSRRRSAKRH